MLLRAFAIILSLLCLVSTREVHARPISALMTDLTSEDRAQQKQALVELGQSHDESSLVILQALLDGRLYVSESMQVLLKLESGKYQTPDGHDSTKSDNAHHLTLTNILRKTAQTSLASQQLRSPQHDIRLQAAEVLKKSPSEDLLPAMRAALAKEQDPIIRKLLSLGLAQSDLASSRESKRLSAIAVIRDSGDISYLPRLQALTGKSSAGRYLESNTKVRKAAIDAVSALEFRKLVSRVARDLLYGLSLGSVLLLAALGLAITFGLMGVINMAHGEMLMLGAYTTYAVQQLFASYLPSAQDFYLLAALPAAFAVCMLAGIAIERTIIRHLYGRPLETLLATFGVSLLLIQTVRLTFGASNVAVANPSYLSGGIELLPELVIPYARLAILLFVVLVVALVWYLLNRTALGLQVRAITQNRGMAAAVGVRTSRIDMLTFGLGSAVAGLGGVALSQIGNVGPELGQSYIVDSFMVVVLGGVGKLIGTVVTSLGLGAINKLLEPISGAVLGKIFVLAIVIAFIQRRPQGLFALKGRAVEG